MCFRLKAFAVFFILIILPIHVLRAADDLARNFQSPPDSARPWAYWVWLNGNVTKEGITRDMEEMRRQGLSGVLVFQAGDAHTPAGAQFFSPEWHELFKHTLREAARLNMVVSIDLCDGWDSGGPWITQDQANKKLTYSELRVDGAQTLDRLLPLPRSWTTTTTTWPCWPFEKSRRAPWLPPW